jgi:hypothetical protein
VTELRQCPGSKNVAGQFERDLTESLRNLGDERPLRYVRRRQLAGAPRSLSKAACRNDFRERAPSPIELVLRCEKATYL